MIYISLLIEVYGIVASCCCSRKMGEGNELTVEQIHRVVPQIIHEYVVSRKVRVFDEGPKNETTP